jgi:hypothetical protein
VAPQRASALLSACAAQEGWFYARSIGDVLGACCELGELLWLSFQHPDVLEFRREWSRIFCFRWHEVASRPGQSCSFRNSEGPR